MMIGVEASIKVLESFDAEERLQHGRTCPESHDEVFVRPNQS